MDDLNKVVWPDGQWQSIRTANRHWVAGYEVFARSRGFTTTLNDWCFVRRSFFECWMEPGFHRFWRGWNPGIAYFVYRLFVLFGGRRNWALPTLLAFVTSGLVHTLVVLPFVQRWSYSVVVAFTCFGVLTVVSRYCEKLLRQKYWPKAVNVLVNTAFVAGSFDIGFRVDRLL